MTTFLALKRLDDLMDEIGSLKRNIGGEFENVELGGIWKDSSTSDKDIEDAKNYLFEEVE